MIIIYILLLIVGIIFAVTVVEFLKLLRMKPAQELPYEHEQKQYSTSINGKSFEDLYLFLSDEDGAPCFTDDEVYTLISMQSEYIKKRFDCSDFRAQLLFKIYKDCDKKLSSDCKTLIKNTFLNFKYFMDEPGDDSMCYWSENHQILFAVSEYLAGQQWQNEIFTNSNLTGKEHMLKAKERISAWMKQRFNYGFSEYLSNNYLAEDIAPMANFIAYAEDENLVEQMKIIMDILWFDVALNSVNNRFVAVSSRMYGNNKAGNIYGNSLQAAINALWGAENSERLLKSGLSENEKRLISISSSAKPNYIVICFCDIIKKGLYILPEVIRETALNKETFVSKMSCGLSPADLKNEGFIGQLPYQIMAQMGAETFTNPEVIENTVEYLRNNSMFTNSFVCFFRFFELSILRKFNLKSFSQRHNILTHGIATGRGNIYTYRTENYTMSTAVCRAVDMCGAQAHEWTANISENLCLFTTHPAGNGNEKFESSPGYWIGNGRVPMTVQHKSVNITIYKMPKKKRLGEKHICSMTHAYMPREFYDSFELHDNVVIARKNNVFVALIANDTLEFKPFNNDSARGIFKDKLFPEEIMLKNEFDLCRFGGDYHIYITELSDTNKETYEEFKKRIQNNTYNFTDQGAAEYVSENNIIEVSYDGIFNINGVSQEKEFLRYDSEFCKAERKSPCLRIKSANHSLILDFEGCIRKQDH